MEPTDERRGRPSASGIERIALCPGSWNLELQIAEPPETSWAAEGTLIHAVLAGEQPDSVLDDDQQRVAGQCRYWEGKILEDLDFLFEPALTLREERLWVTMADVDLSYSGKPDLIYNDGNGRLVVMDWKTGRGAVTPAESNWQMRSLAVLAWHHSDPRATEAIVAIIQPRSSDPVTICRYSLADLEQSIHEIRRVLSAAEASDAPRVAGEKQCKYCKATAICPAARELALSIIPESAIDPGTRKVIVPTLTGPELGELLPKLEVAGQVIEAVKQQAKKFLQEGGKIPGYQLKPGNSKRVITDAEKAFQRLELDASQFLPCVSVSIAQLEKAYGDVSGLKGKALKSKITEALGDALELKESEPSLSPVAG